MVGAKDLVAVAASRSHELNLVCPAQDEADGAQAAQRFLAQGHRERRVIQRESTRVHGEVEEVALAVLKQKQVESAFRTRLLEPGLSQEELR